MSLLKSKQDQFQELYGGLDDNQTLKQILYESQQQTKKLEKIRSNTSILVWCLVILPLAVLVVYFMMKV